MSTLTNTLTKISTVTVSSGGIAQIDFDLTSITGYTDILIKVSARDDRSADWTSVYVKFNDSTTNFTNKHLYGIGSGGGYSTNYSTGVLLEGENASTTTSNVFSSYEIYIPNYTSSNYKSWSVDSVTENNATTSYCEMVAGLWSNTAAITKVSILLSGSIKFVQNTTATLYGVNSVGATSAIKATGGTIYNDDTYIYHLFTGSSTFTPTSAITADLLVVAGGGGAGCYGGGGGAGGYRLITSRSMSSGVAYAVTVGGGGNGSSSRNSAGSNGNNSSVAGSGFSTISATAGGGGGSAGSGTAASGGSGGGRTYNNNTGGTGNAGGYTPVEGYNGGNGSSGSGDSNGGGGGAGGAGGAPTNSSLNGGLGGVGSSTASAFGLATGTGQNVLGTVYYAGGGGGSSEFTGAIATGGYGGGGNSSLYAAGTPNNGLTNTGGGGGATRDYGASGYQSGSGGSGVVIIRYAR